jgi:hypothetical protein
LELNRKSQIANRKWEHMDPSRTQSMFDQSETPEAPADAFHEAMEHVGELKEYVSLYVAAKLDKIKVSVRRIVLYAVLGVLALVVGAAMLVMASVQLLSGLAGVIAAGLGGRMWAGNLIVGFVLLTGIMLGAWLMVRRMFNSSRKATVDRYERRLQRQRVDFGADAHQRSAEYAAEHKSQA